MLNLTGGAAAAVKQCNFQRPLARLGVHQTRGQKLGQLRLVQRRLAVDKEQVNGRRDLACSDTRGGCWHCTRRRSRWLQQTHLGRGCWRHKAKSRQVGGIQDAGFELFDLGPLWQGAAVPIPSLTMVTDRSAAVVFGLTAEELAEARRRLPYMAESIIPPGTYRGQAAPVLTFSAWNFVVGNRTMPEEAAYALTRAALTAEDPRAAIHPSAIGTRAANARNNAILPFHPGAARFYAEQGVTLAAPPG